MLIYSVHHLFPLSFFLFMLLYWWGVKDVALPLGFFWFHDNIGTFNQSSTPFGVLMFWGQHTYTSPFLSFFETKWLCTDLLMMLHKMLKPFIYFGSLLSWSCMNENCNIWPILGLLLS